MSRDLFVFLFMISLLLYLVVYYFYLINATPGPSDAFMVKKRAFIDAKSSMALSRLI
jgi:hypothetical protein